MAHSVPITPDFEELLFSVPDDDRTGFVFAPVLYRGICRRTDTVSKTLSKLGKSAGVKIDECKKREKGKREAKSVPVFASAHDYRRAFGDR